MGYEKETSDREFGFKRSDIVQGGEKDGEGLESGFYVNAVHRLPTEEVYYMI